MKVRALSLGYYDEMRRREGEVFELKTRSGVRVDKATGQKKKVTYTPEQQFSSDWMEKVDQKTKLEKPEKVSGRSPNFVPEESGVARAAHEPRRQKQQEPQDEGDSVI